MDGFPAIAIAQGAAAGDHLQSRVEYSSVKPLLKSLVHVADFPELVFDPTGFDFLLIRSESCYRRIIFLQRFECSLGGQHAALDCKVNALEARGIQESCRVAEDHPSITSDRRNGPPAAVRHRLRAIADHLSAFEQLRNKGIDRK